jgi:hypothetical protein
MSVYLLTVTRTQSIDLGIRLSPGIYLDEMPDAVRGMRQGSSILLRFPDGETVSTELASYGVVVDKAENGDFLFNGDPCRPEFSLIIPAAAGEIPLGTEVWLP